MVTKKPKGFAAEKIHKEVLAARDPHEEKSL